MDFDPPESVRPLLETIARFIDEHVLADLRRRVEDAGLKYERGARIYGGPDEVHKMVVAKRILARYAS